MNQEPVVKEETQDPKGQTGSNGVCTIGHQLR